MEHPAALRSRLQQLRLQSPKSRIRAVAPPSAQGKRSWPLQESAPLDSPAEWGRMPEPPTWRRMQSTRQESSRTRCERSLATALRRAPCLALRKVKHVTSMPTVCIAMAQAKPISCCLKQCRASHLPPGCLPSHRYGQTARPIYYRCSRSCKLHKREARGGGDPDSGGERRTNHRRQARALQCMAVFAQASDNSNIRTFPSDGAAGGRSNRPQSALADSALCVDGRRFVRVEATSRSSGLVGVALGF